MEYITKIVYTILLPISIAIVLVYVEGAYFITYQSDGWTVQQHVCINRIRSALNRFTIWIIIHFRKVGNTSKGMNHLFVLHPTGSLSESFFFTFILPYYMVFIGFTCFFAWHTFNTALMRYISFRLDVVKYRLENMPVSIDDSSFLYCKHQHIQRENNKVKSLRLKNWKESNSNHMCCSRGGWVLEFSLPNRIRMHQ